MVFQPDILPEPLQSPSSASDPITHPPSPSKKILDPSSSLHHKDRQSLTRFKKASKKRPNPRPDIVSISSLKGKESFKVNIMGTVAAEPKKPFQCAFGNRDWLLNFTIIDIREPSVKISVSYFAQKPANLPPIEHEDVIVLLGASHKFRPKFGWQLQITRHLNTQWKVFKMKQPKSKEKEEGEEELCPSSYVLDEQSEKDRQDEQEKHNEQEKQENEQ